jgi:hypothetical protein
MLEEEYPKERLGSNPPGTGGVRMAYDQEKSPDCGLADQVAEGCSEVALKSPLSLDSPATAAKSVPCTWPAADDVVDAAAAGAAVTSALSVCLSVSLTDLTGTAWLHSGRFGAVRIHAGS